MWRLTEGHPLYLLSGLRAARDQGAIEVAAGTWRLAGRLTAALEDLVRFRLHGLGGPARRALELVAVGGPVPSARLERLAGAGGVAELAERGLVAVASSEAGAPVSAGHPLFAEVLSRSLPPERCRELLVELARAMLDDDRPTGRSSAAWRPAATAWRSPAVSGRRRAAG